MLTQCREPTIKNNLGEFLEAISRNIDSLNVPGTGSVHKNAEKG
jgi:hypothetical protein